MSETFRVIIDPRVAPNRTGSMPSMGAIHRMLATESKVTKFGVKRKKLFKRDKKTGRFRRVMQKGARRRKVMGHGIRASASYSLLYVKDRWIFNRA